MSEKAEKSEKLEKPHKKKTEKPFEGRKYALWPSKSVITLAEMCGFSGIGDELVNKLGEDVSYRLREIIHDCSVHMRHTNERKLKSALVAKVLPGSSDVCIHGYSCGGSADFIHVPSADVFIPENTTIQVNLVEMALGNEVYEQKGDSCVKGIWYLPDEVPESSATTETADSAVTPPPIPPHLERYYNTFAKAILCKHDKVFQVVLQDLKSNSSIGLVVPCFVNLVMDGLTDLPRNSVACERLLWVLQALTLNRDVYPDTLACVRGLLTGLLIFTVDPRVPDTFPLSRDLELRNTASMTLAMVVQNWYGSEDSLIRIITEKLNGVLFDSSSTLRSHCGALNALYALGPEAVGYCLWPNLEQYLQFLNLLNIEQETVELFGCILMVAEYLYWQDWELAEDSPEGINLALTRMIELDRLLYEHFGDALCAYRRQIVHLASKRSLKRLDYLVNGRDDRVSEVLGASKQKGYFRETVIGGTLRAGTPRVLKCPIRSLKSQKLDVQQIDLNKVFELSAQRRDSFIQIGVNGIPAWSGALRQRRLDPFQQHCEMSSPYVQRCCSLDFVGRKVLKHVRRVNCSGNLSVVL